MKKTLELILSMALSFGGVSLTGCDTKIPQNPNDPIGITPTTSTNGLSWAQEEKYNFAVNGTTLLRNNSPFFIKGLDYGGWPIGYSPHYTESFPDDSELFRKDFDLISGLGANFVVVYPQLMPRSFFDELSRKELFYSRDIYIDGYTEDLHDSIFKKNSENQIKKVIDNTYTNGNPNRLVFFSVGDEVNAGTIFRTDTRHPEIREFNGNFINMTGTPSEVAIAELVDFAKSYESTTYGTTHLYTHSSWTHIGPVRGPDLEVSEDSIFFADFGDLIAMNIYTYARGVKSSNGGSVTNRPFQGYLEELGDLVTKPIVITQTGLSTSPIAPNPQIPEFGGNTTEEQASTLRQSWEDLTTARNKEKYAGICFFEFSDEWWKGPIGDPPAATRDPFFQESDDPEEWFGIYTINREPKGNVPQTLKDIFTQD